MTEKTIRVIQAIAMKEGISPKEVESKMMEAIRAGMASTNPRAQALWKQICPDGKEPDLDTFLNFLVGRVNSVMNILKSEKNKDFLS